MKRRSTWLISLFVMLFALAAMGTSDSAKPPAKNPHENEAPSRSSGDSPVLAPDLNAEKRQEFLTSNFALTADQPPLFEQNLTAGGEEAGVYAAELMGSVEPSELTELVNAMTGRTDDCPPHEAGNPDEKRREQDCTFYKSLLWGASMQQTGESSKATEEFKKGFVKRKAIKDGKTACYLRATKALETATEPKVREEAQKELEGCGFSKNHLLARAKFYGRKDLGKENDRAARALDAAAELNEKGQLAVHVQNPTTGHEDTTDSIYLGEGSKPWAERQSLAKWAAKELDDRYGKVPFLPWKPLLANAKQQWLLPEKPADGETKPSLTEVEENRIPAVKPPEKKPDPASETPAELVYNSRTEGIAAGEAACNGCHKKESKPPFAEFAKDKEKLKDVLGRLQSTNIESVMPKEKLNYKTTPEGKALIKWVEAQVVAP